MFNNLVGFTMVNKVFFSVVVFILFFLSLGVNVVIAKNPVYSIFYLVLFFITGSCLIALFGYDYLALIFILVYVGAIAVLFLFVIMILDIKIVNKPTIFHKVTSIDFVGHCTILLVIFCIFSPNFFFFFNMFLAFFFVCWYYFMMAMWPFFDFIVLMGDPIFSPICLIDPYFFMQFEGFEELPQCVHSLVDNSWKIFSFHNIFEVCSLLSGYFYKVLYCVYPSNWYFLLNDYKVDFRIIDIFWVFKYEGVNICEMTRHSLESECDIDMKCIECVEQSRANLLKLGKFIAYFKAVEEIYSNVLDDIRLCELDVNHILWVDFDSSVKNLQVLYTDFTLWFILCGGILLVAMISCISLALPSKQNSFNKKLSFKFSKRLKKVNFKSSENYN
uniref:NADH dehydrogenase subunit 6 n=1 Tax=Protohalopteris sp. TaxID=2843287 RepID=A0A8F0K280_9PHAE|nr:NADH dehydrogenase subunit 6 [Protohalopteris sp.]